ncbi:putative NADPH-quinone reductase [Actinoplanes campanulatus]|uniref:Putative NADPH-quinone reductase n=1 Tax=Actinoplanes campanulatus TaxID=113559 RepID=A0A7W5ASN1_9ACTN|nr:NAD(P)H oxidoreductase [Actinoplanes campanulatus]MBB3101134.1 putative NADPH-quinone reductase [Actinoplanes campanulatus]GGN51625.1 NADPH oxidoreductase [Actinoplanes campanulatus]GID42578.1 NADPH oxidoreductase [Actinoplanes campanulatus]
MSRPHALLVVAHPRPDSLTTATAARARDTLAAGGWTVDLLDLYREGFDPSLRPDDEPDWGDAAKEYSAEVRAHMARITAADLIVVVFPVWWWGLPAIAKGWVDRVWNRGFAYEPSTLEGKRMRWVGLAAGSAAHYTTHGFDKAIDLQLRVGISEYCGITDATVHLVYDTLGEPDVTGIDEVLASPAGSAPAGRIR